jgi:hypothetical protein
MIAGKNPMRSIKSPVALNHGAVHKYLQKCGKGQYFNAV